MVEIGLFIILIIFTGLTITQIELQNENDELKEEIINLKLELAKYDLDLMDSIFEEED